MDLSTPIRSVIPSAHGGVLNVLAQTGTPLSGRQIAEQADGISKTGVQRVLTALVEAGIVLADDHPPARLYRLNRDHVAADAIAALSSLRAILLERMRGHAASWRVRPAAVWLFGSAARGDGSSASDLDVLVVRPDTLSDEDPEWRDQVATFADMASRWSGNSCEVVEVSKSELIDMAVAGERLVEELQRDAITLAGKAPRQLLRERSRAS